jgi:hypothetical protein
MAETITIRTSSATDVIQVIEAGPQGPTGATGANGQGVPVGGTTGQVLRKASGTNYDTEWAAAASGSGSVTSVALAGTGLSISGSPITTSGTITANVAYGTTASTAAEGNDARLSDARTPLSHTHGNLTNAGAIGTTSGLPVKTGTSGVIEAGAFGTAAGSFCEGNDSRLTDARTPSSTLAHASTHHTGGSDPLSPANIGAAATAHTHAASDITSGVLDNARVNFAAPGAIGGTTAAAANFTTVGATDIITAANATASPPTTTSAARGLLFPSLGGANNQGAVYGSYPGTPAVGIGLGTSAGSLTQVAAFTSSGLSVTGAAELVNGASAAGPFFIYRTFTDASNYERGFIRWNSGVLSYGTERLGGSGNIDLEFRRSGNTFLRLATNGFNVDTVLTVNSTFGPILNGGAIRFQTTEGEFPAILARDAFNILAMRNGTNAQEYRVYGIYTSDTNFQRLTIKTKAVTLSGLTGASVATTTGLIPDGAVLVGLTTRVSTAITGATGYNIGDGSDADRWGANVAIALNTSSDNTNWTAGTIECFTAAQEVTLTAVGSNFTGGAVVIVAHYLAGEAD